MEFRLTERQLALQGMAREFARREIRPVARELDRRPDPKDRSPVEVLDKASRLGLRTLGLAEEWGGGGADMVTLCIVGEELGWGDLGTSVILEQDWKLSRVFETLMTEEQKGRFLRAFAGDHRYHFSIAGTEPDSGSDNLIPVDAPGAGMHTSAVRKGAGWVINGMKHFIFNAGLSKLYMVNTRTDPSAGITKGTTFFLLTPDMEGFSYGRYHDKLGMRLGPNRELVFRDLQAPDGNRLGEVNGAYQARRKVRGSNIEAVGPCLGVARAAYEDALEYARNRVQGGRPIIGHQAVGFLLCDCFVQLEAARRLLHYAAWTAEDPAIYDPKMAFMTKAYMGETCFDVVRKALEVWGGMGYMTEAPMEKYLRDVTAFLHSEATNQVMRVRSMPFL
ncbi:MAG: acyl-CoA/acyl-ACP dehydrogenase [Candidatus Tectomicrobia bacterium]|uniref:Acyl-CoA/acyl-ACP dehydrogenase n=1 Tax=Tectimicrobiota bacterium TaxID=2528274 RepID=A0A932I0A6_UNCTE|nr:acyl-CoA/acyl-ACP dehydrogenase [Candidatus Tectomicrobia bacterium]